MGIYITLIFFNKLCSYIMQYIICFPHGPICLWKPVITSTLMGNLLYYPLIFISIIYFRVMTHIYYSNAIEMYLYTNIHIHCLRITFSNFHYSVLPVVKRWWIPVFKQCKARSSFTQSVYALPVSSQPAPFIWLTIW